MARTILEIAQEAAERDATAPPPSTLFDTNARTARILRTAAHDVLREVMRGGGWRGMSELLATWAFTLAPGRYAYPLPPDYLRWVPRTEQRDGWPLGLVGPASPQAWSRWIFGGEAVAAPMGWRVRNNAIWIEPVPTRAELVVVEYVSRYPVVGPVRTADLDLAAKPIRAESPFVLRDGYMAVSEPGAVDVQDGGDYGPGGGGWDVDEYGEEIFEALRRLHPLSAEAPLPEVRRPYFTADADKPAFDDDYILSLGMTFHLQRALGLPYAERAAEFEAEMEARAGDDAGGARGFRLGSEIDGYETVPLGGGQWLVS